MLNHNGRETRDVRAPIDLAFVVGSIRARAPELADDLDAAITIWFEHSARFAIQDTDAGLATRRSRLGALRELLALSPYEPDPRD